MSSSKKLSPMPLINPAGTGVQKIQIVFTFIGEFAPQDEFIPDKKEIPQEYL